MNDLIALVDSDPALHFRGAEAQVLAPLEESGPGAAAVVHCSCGDNDSLVIVNLSGRRQTVAFDPKAARFDHGTRLYDNIAGREHSRGEDGCIRLALEPFQRLWLSADRIPIHGALLSPL